MIKTIGLSKRFDDTWALSGLELDIKQGEFYCLLGPNGAGKTTTLKLLAGLIKPTDGSIFVNNFDMALDSLDAKKCMGYIPDTPFIYENLTGYEFLEFVGDIFSIPRRELDERINAYLEMFGLTAAKDALIRDYSHGMRQKIVYISNFIHDPKVLFVDEPLVGLDPASIHLIKKLLKERTKDGMAILMCTHILHIAEELADRVGILDKGVLIAEDTLAALRLRLAQGSLEDIFLKLTSG